MIFGLCVCVCVCDNNNNCTCNIYTPVTNSYLKKKKKSKIQYGLCVCTRVCVVIPVVTKHARCIYTCVDALLTVI